MLAILGPPMPREPLERAASPEPYCNDSINDDRDDRGSINAEANNGRWQSHDREQEADPLSLCSSQWFASGLPDRREHSAEGEQGSAKDQDERWYDRHLITFTEK